MPEKSRGWDVYRYIPFIGNRSVESYRATWDVSPYGPNGRLKLQANAYSLNHTKNIFAVYDGKGAAWPPLAQTAGTVAEAGDARRSAYASAYSQFRGRIYKGSAALGVTLGSYAQSREMIVSRCRSISAQAEEIFTDFGRRHQVRGRAAKRLASTYLEVVFGWKPLLQDIHNAATSVIQLADARESVKGRASGHYHHFSDVWDGAHEQNMKISANGTVHVTLASMITIANPNRWLLERAGLLNPAAVAWDLVPWSFVINMFANTGGLVNSITDFAGLSFQNASVTTTFREAGGAASQWQYHSTWPVPYDHYSSFTSSWTSVRKYRTVEGIPRPPLVLKVPNANWELAGIAASLMVQQVSRIGGIVRRLRGG